MSALTKRDYFLVMAHAPKEVPEWFIPKMLTECPVVPNLQSVDISSDFGQRLWSAWENDIEPEGVDADVGAWITARFQAEQDQTAWQIEFRRQAVFQWPLAWAMGLEESLSNAGL